MEFFGFKPVNVNYISSIYCFFARHVNCARLLFTSKHTQKNAVMCQVSGDEKQQTKKALKTKCYFYVFINESTVVQFHHSR